MTLISELLSELSKVIPNGDLCDIVTLDYKTTNIVTKPKKLNILRDLQMSNLINKTFQFEILPLNWTLGITRAPSHQVHVMSNDLTSILFSAFSVGKAMCQSDLYAIESVDFPGFYLKVNGALR